LKRKKNSAETTLAAAGYSGGGAGVYVTVEIKNNGLVTTVKINGNIVFDSVSTPDYSYGKIGFYTWWQPAWFDDVDIRAKSTVTSLSKLETVGKTGLEIFPNPVTGDLLNVKIAAIKEETTHWSIFDLSGKLLLTGKNTQQQFSISTQTLKSPGIYLLKLSMQNASFQQKIVLF